MRKDRLINLEEGETWDNLVLHLRNKVYLGDSVDGKKPYLFSKINLVTQMDPMKILPTAKYVLNDNLKRLNKIINSGIDIFSLNGLLKLPNDYLICPPILEVWEDEPYNSRPVIVDGGHRVFLAKEYGCLINCIIISQPISFPLPVLPLGGWHQVDTYDQVPKDKRNYNPNIADPLNPHKYYRLGLPGSLGSRGK